jgi:hypothetical protein
MHYLPLGDESSPRGRWGICARALPEVLTKGHGKISAQEGKGKGRKKKDKAKSKYILWLFLWYPVTDSVL